MARSAAVAAAILAPSPRFPPKTCLLTPSYSSAGVGKIQSVGHPVHGYPPTNCTLASSSPHKGGTEAPMHTAPQYTLLCLFLTLVGIRPQPSQKQLPGRATVAAATATAGVPAWLPWCHTRSKQQVGKQHRWGQRGTELGGVGHMGLVVAWSPCPEGQQECTGWLGRMWV